MAIEVIYNGETLPQVYGDMYFSENYHSVTFRCNFLITAASSSSLMTQEEDIRAAIAEPLKAISAKYDGNDQYILNHTSNTALNPFCTMTKIQNSEWNTELTRAYVFEYAAQLPADISGHNFRRYTQSSFTISETPSGVQSVHFKLTYTAGDTESSLENFEAFAEAYAFNVLSLVEADRVFETVGRHFVTDDEHKITTADLYFDQIVEDQLESIVDDERIKKANVSYKISLAERKTISHTANVEGIEWNKLFISYSCQIKEGSFANKQEVELFYHQSIKTWLIIRAIEILKPDTKANSSEVVCIMNDTFSFNPSNNHLLAELEMFSPFDSSQLVVQVIESLSFVLDEGRKFNKIWDGRPNTYAIYEMGSTEKLIRSVNVKRIGTPPDFPPFLGNFLGNTYIRENAEERRQATISYGLQSTTFSPEAKEIIVFESTFVEIYRLVEDIANLPNPQGAPQGGGQ